MRILTFLDLAQNELRNGVIQNLASAPSAPKPGQEYYGTSGNVGYVWNGTAWRPMDAAALTDGSIQIAAIGAFQSTVLGYRLDQFAAPTNPVTFNGQRVTSIGAATASTDAVQYGQVQSAITSAINGVASVKNPARLCAASNVTLSSPGSTFDGVAANAGDRILLAAQTTASQNGLYTFNGASSALTLTADGNASSQWLEGTEILVAEGAVYTGAIFSQSTAAPTLTTLTFVQRNKINAYTAGNGLSLTGFTFAVQVIASGGVLSSPSGLSIDTTVVARKFSTVLTGTGSAASFVVTHNLGTQNPIVGITDSSNNEVLVDVVMTSTTALAVNFGSAPASGTTYNVTVIG